MPRKVTREDRMNLLGGPIEFLIRMEKAGIVPDNMCMVHLLDFIPLTHVVESSLLILGADTDTKNRFVFYHAIVDRILKRKDNAAAKEILRVIKHYGMIPLDVVLLNRLCEVIDNESDVFQHLNYMQMTGMRPDVITFQELFSLPWSLYDFAYRKKLLMEMSWLNICPNERILTKLKSINQAISTDLLEQENGMIKAGCDDKPYISREEFEDFMTFFNEWLAMYNLQS
uniref:Uncharacterized protein n=1 Tax=Pinctada fucata TaxID=50426 RepID=A0A194AL43_PINFU